MYTTLDHLASHHRPHRSPRVGSWFREVMIFVLFVFGASIVSNVFVNAQVFISAIEDLLPFSSQPNIVSQVVATGSLSATIQQADAQYQLEQRIQSLLDQHDTDDMIPVDVGYDQTIKQKLNTYQLSFNTLPPTNRLVIASIGLNVPIIDIPYKTQEHKDKGSYDKELYEGVVKYPTTPNPTMPGNMFLFGHSSFYWRKNNPYGTVFKDLPKLKESDTIIVQREGKEYHYNVIARHIVMPKQVNGIYDQYKDGDYVTLMGCYPIGSDEKRLLVIAKKV